MLLESIATIGDDVETHVYLDQHKTVVTLPFGLHRAPAGGLPVPGTPCRRETGDLTR